MSRDEEIIRWVIASTECDIAACKMSLRTVEEFLVTHGARIEKLTQDEGNCLETLRRQTAMLSSSMHEIFNTIDDFHNA